MGYRPAQEQFTREEIHEILRRNVNLFKDDPGFATYFTDLTLYLLASQSSSDSAAPPFAPHPPAGYRAPGMELSSGEINLRVFLEDDGRAPDLLPPTAYDPAAMMPPKASSLQSFDESELDPPTNRFPAPPIAPPAPTAPAAAATPRAFPRLANHTPLPDDVPSTTNVHGAIPSSGMRRPVAPSPSMPAPALPPPPVPGAPRPFAVPPRPVASNTGIPKLPSVPIPPGATPPPSAAPAAYRPIVAPPSPPPAPPPMAPAMPVPPQLSPSLSRPSGLTPRPNMQQPYDVPSAQPPSSPPLPLPETQRPHPVSMRSSGIIQMQNAPLITPPGGALRDRQPPPVPAPPPAPLRRPDVPAPPDSLGGKTQVYRVVRPYRSQTSMESPCPVCGSMVSMDAAHCPGCGHKMH